MKKKLIIGGVMVLMMSLCSCSSSGGDVDNSTSSSSSLVLDSSTSSSSTENDSTSQTITEITKYQDLFVGDWNKPGLFEKDGKAHEMPSYVEENGMENNVLDFGAKANDPTFDNYSAFKKAIEASSEGDTVYVPEGTFYFKNYVKASSEYTTHIKLKSGVILKGAGKGLTTIVSCFEESMNRDESTTVIAAVNVKNVIIKDLTVTSNTSDSMLPDPDNSNLQTTVYSAPKYGITAASGGAISNEEDQARNILIDNVLVEKFQRMAVRVAKVQEVVVSNSTFQKATCLGGGGMGYGVCIQGYGNNFDCTDSYIDTRYNIIKDCEFVGPYIRHGALIQYSAHNNLVTNNKFKDTLLDSIDMHGEDEYSNEICNNEIINSRKGAGIGLGNTGATHDASGRNNYIHDNYINKGNRGIDVLLGTPNTIIYNNIISNVKSGIKCNDANGTWIESNTLESIDGDGLNVTYAYNPEDPEKGIPDYYSISNNKFISCNRAVYIESKGENFVFENNAFEKNKKDVVDESANFITPQKSTLTDPVEGEVVLPTQNFFITMESPNECATYQKNLKLKTSNLEPLYNRVIYALFDKTLMPENYNKVYLSITAKAQVGKPTINIFSNTTYVDWKENQICWNNSKLHHPTLGLIENTEEDPVKEFTTFTFPVASYEFQTYYIDVTEAYAQLGEDLFTLVLTNEGIDESYMEIYSKDQYSNNPSQAFRLIFN